MRIAIGSDHRGYSVKGHVAGLVQQLGHDIEDVGTNTSDSCDYPDYAERVARLVADGKADRGILICGTGIGMAIAANKVPGVRAAACTDPVMAEMSRRHNDLNVLCLSADLVSEKLTDQVVEIWLKTEFESGRHARRVDKITQIEKHCEE